MSFSTSLAALRLVGPESLTVFLVSISACSIRPFSRPTDIFTQDQGDPAAGNDRRRPAQGDEWNWTVFLKGCTGHLVAPTVLMTANHCLSISESAAPVREGATFPSGYAMTQHASPD